MIRHFSAAVLAVVVGSGAAFAQEHVVEMLNEGADGERMVFEPAVIAAEPGDTVRFVPTDRGHNAATLRGGVPEDAETVRGGMNQEIVYEVTADGVHVIQCTPHYGLGMIAVIVSGGDFSNVDEVRDAIRPRKAAERFESYLDRAGAPAAG